MTKMWFNIVTIKHKHQRYNTIGDWFDGEKGTFINVSELANRDYEFLIMIHEMIEAYICRRTGVTQKEVDKFDFKSKDDEPGDNPKAPYHAAHMFASAIERLIACNFGINWQQYEKKIEEVSKTWGKKK